jgi:hypothetical protein
VATDISIQERAIKALREITELVVLWASGKVTHQSAMERVDEIVRKAK